MTLKIKLRDLFQYIRNQVGTVYQNWIVLQISIALISICDMNNNKIYDVWPWPIYELIILVSMAYAFSRDMFDFA